MKGIVVGINNNHNNLFTIELDNGEVFQNVESTVNDITIFDNVICKYNTCLNILIIDKM